MGSGSWETRCDVAPLEQTYGRWQCAVQGNN